MSELPKCRRAVLLGCGLRWHSGPVLEGHLGSSAPGVNRRAVGCVPSVIPDRSAIGGRRDCVHVIAEELQPQVVLARAAWVASRLRFSSLHAPGAPFVPMSACFTTPTSVRRLVVSLRNGVVKALYTRYASVPLGEIAMAE